MKFIEWFHHLFNPHCIECKEDAICQSCETLRFQLEVANSEKKLLLEALTRRNEPEPVTTAAVPEPITPRFVPWRVRQQALEAEAREAARIMRNRIDEINKEAKPAGVVTAPTLNVPTEELEKELDLVEQEREGHGS